jgi:hypothetical protein
MGRTRGGRSLVFCLLEHHRAPESGQVEASFIDLLQYQNLGYLGTEEAAVSPCSGGSPGAAFTDSPRAGARRSLAFAAALRPPCPELKGAGARACKRQRETM